MTKKEQVIQDIRDRKLAIKNDDLEAARKCAKIIWPLDGWAVDEEMAFIYSKVESDDFYTFCTIELSDCQKNSIPATELLKILEGEESVNNANEIKNKIQELEQELDFLKGEEKKLGCEEWMPEVGEMVEVSSDGEEWWGKEDSYTYFGKGDNRQPFLVLDNTDGTITSFSFCRPIQKKQITVSELFEKAGLNEKEWEVVK